METSQWIGVALVVTGATDFLVMGPLLRERVKDPGAQRAAFLAVSLSGLGLLLVGLLLLAGLASF